MDSKDLLDRAFRQASKTGSAVKTQRIKKKRITADLERVETVTAYLGGNLKGMLKQTQVHLNPFQQELMANAIDMETFKKQSKQAMDILKILKRLANEYSLKIKFSDTPVGSDKHRKAFYGRVSSLLKGFKFNEIDNYIKELNALPKITDLETIIICGYPNVGKSMILKNLSGSKVKTAPYPFTTQEILIGFMNKGYEKIQLIDTPGLLDRPIERRNKIEEKAVLALKHLSKDLVFVIDPSETCGYPLKDQLNLLEDVKKKFRPRLMLVATKKDIEEKKLPIKTDAYINATDEEEVKQLGKQMLSFFYCWKK